MTPGSLGAVARRPQPMARRLGESSSASESAVPLVNRKLSPRGQCSEPRHRGADDSPDAASMLDRQVGRYRGKCANCWVSKHPWRAAIVSHRPFVQLCGLGRACALRDGSPLDEMGGHPELAERRGPCHREQGAGGQASRDPGENAQRGERRSLRAYLVWGGSRPPLMLPTSTTAASRQVYSIINDAKAQSARKASPKSCARTQPPWPTRYPLTPPTVAGVACGARHRLLRGRGRARG